jgi:hypothetical protein
VEGSNCLPWAGGGERLQVREAIAGGGKQSQMEESGRWWREAIAGGKQAMTGGGYRSEVAREESDCSLFFNLQVSGGK